MTTSEDTDRRRRLFASRLRGLVTPPAYSDGLDSVIGLFTALREESLQREEQTRAAHPEAHIGPVMLTMPAEALDDVVLALGAARSYRNYLHRNNRHRTIATVLVVIVNLAACALNLLLAFT